MVDDVSRHHEEKHDAEKKGLQSPAKTQREEMLQAAEGSGPQDAGVEHGVGGSVRVQRGEFLRGEAKQEEQECVQPCRGGVGPLEGEKSCEKSEWVVQVGEGEVREDGDRGDGEKEETEG